MVPRPCEDEEELPRKERGHACRPSAGVGTGTGAGGAALARKDGEEAARPLHSGSEQIGSERWVERFLLASDCSRHG